MLDRLPHLRAVEIALRENPIAAVLGPRQCGKTTLARQMAEKRKKAAHFFDLEDPVDLARLENPNLLFRSLKGLVIIDEIQRQPGLFTLLRPLADRRNSKTKFLILGSAAPELIRGASESLAGRVGFVDMGGFDLRETGAASFRQLWMRGGFPRSYLALSDEASLRWRQDFMRSFLERDIPQLGIRIAPEAMRRFWMMVAHYHGQIWNGSEFARSLGVTEHTVRGYLDVLTGTYVVRQLMPWFENMGKRQYKSPKIYVRDSGLLHALLSLAAEADVQSHPKYGASWEGFAIEQILSATGSYDAFNWGTHAGAELDLLLIRHGKRYGFEFKVSDAPTMTKSLHIALQDLSLEKAWIVYPGDVAYPIHEKVDVLPLTQIGKALSVLK